MANKRILIVEDSMDIGRMLQSAIATLDSSYEVTWMRSAEEAILETSRHKLDLVVTDIRLPGIDGFELIRRVRRRLPDVRVIVVTGLAERDLRKQVLEVKPDAVLEKPVQVSVFLERVKAALEMGEAKPAPVVQTSPVNSMQLDHEIPLKLTDLLSRLHLASGAQMVLLLDAEGSLAADVAAPQTGLAVESKRLKNILSEASGLTFAGKRAQVVVRGTQAEWILQPVGSEFTLALLLPAGGSLLRLALALEEIQKAQNDLVAFFGKTPGKTGPLSEASLPQKAVAQAPAETPVDSAQTNDLLAALKAAEPAPAAVVDKAPQVVEKAPPEPAPEPVVEDPAALEAFASLFSQAEAAPAVTDADSFWESAAESKRAFTGIADAITFEEAQQMGLTPDEDAE